MTLLLISCSLIAHDQNVLARRPQWDQQGCHFLESKTGEIQRNMSGETR